MTHWHYLFVLIVCLVLTAPLEFLGPGVYRRPRLLFAALLPVVVVFVAWDLLAIAGEVWSFDERYTLGIELPGSMPLEELLFFVVVPICGLLTFVAVDTLLSRARLRARRERSGR